MMQSIINVLVLVVTFTKMVEGFLTPHSNPGLNRVHHSVRHQTLAMASSVIPSYLTESESPRTLIRKGMQSFRDGDVSSSLLFFDRADDAVADGSLRPYLWQRGISYYYLDRFMEGSEQVCYSVTKLLLSVVFYSSHILMNVQFRLDVSVNPLVRAIATFFFVRTNSCKHYSYCLLSIVIRHWYIHRT